MRRRVIEGKRVRMHYTYIPSPLLRHYRFTPPQLQLHRTSSLRYLLMIMSLVLWSTRFLMKTEFSALFPPQFIQLYFVPVYTTKRRRERTRERVTPAERGMKLNGAILLSRLLPSTATIAGQSLLRIIYLGTNPFISVKLLVGITLLLYSPKIFFFFNSIFSILIL